MSRLGIVTGMVAEADRLAAAVRSLSEPARPLVAAAGGDASRATTQARSFAEAGVSGLVSFGIAGGLDPSLAPGDVVLADRVVAPDGTAYSVDERWRLSVAAMLTAIGPVRQGSIVGANRALTRPADKAALHERMAVLAVDMESHAVAAVGAEAGLPVLVLRVVADPASRVVPSCALAGIGADGAQRPFAVLAQLAVHPWEMPALIRIARDTATAMRSLAAAAPRLLHSR